MVLCKLMLVYEDRDPPRRHGVAPIFSHAIYQTKRCCFALRREYTICRIIQRTHSISPGSFSHIPKFQLFQLLCQVCEIP